VTHLTDPNENVVEKYEYTPYGLTKIRDGGERPFRAIGGRKPVDVHWTEVR
jgi:hypothetical protein